LRPATVGPGPRHAGGTRALSRCTPASTALLKCRHEPGTIRPSPAFNGYVPHPSPRGDSMRAMLTSCLALTIIFTTFSEAAEVSELLKKLRSSDNTERRQAAQDMAELSPEEGKSVVPALIKAVRDRDLFVRRYAVAALGKLGMGNKEAVTA